MEEQRIGSAAFFDPETMTSPFRGMPPWIKNLSMRSLHNNRPVYAGQIFGPKKQRQPFGRTYHLFHRFPLIIPYFHDKPSSGEEMLWNPGYDLLYYIESLISSKKGIGRFIQENVIFHRVFFRFSYIRRVHDDSEKPFFNPLERITGKEEKPLGNTQPICIFTGNPKRVHADVVAVRDEILPLKEDRGDHGAGAYADFEYFAFFRRELYGLFHEELSIGTGDEYMPVHGKVMGIKFFMAQNIGDRFFL